MDEKELKTSPKQRFFIILIAVIMLGSIIASYIAIVINGGKANTGTTGEAETISEEKTAEYEADYETKLAEFQVATKSDFDKMVGYKKEISAFNETAANNGGVQSRDIKTGSGRELGENDQDYMAYYIGYCADESIFDSSFDDNDNPTGFSAYGLLDLSQMSLIEGWYAGMTGAKLGGVREITIASDLAYGDTKEICGGTSKPLRFIVLAKERDADLARMSSELQQAYMKYQYAIYYGVDYDSISN